MSNVQPAAPATRNRRSDRHAPAKQVTPLPPAPSKKPAAKPGAGKFPVRTCIVLGMVLIICILALGIARGNLNRLHKERENGIHPAYVAAIILRESSYDPKATSSVGARGLMQVMESTFEFVRKKLGEDNTTFADMYDPTTNIRYGCWYLGYLSRMFNGDPIKIACAYHAGPNNVKLWIMNYTADGQTLTLDEIPKDDSRYYAGKVVNAYDIYYQHYYPDAS